MYPMISLGLNVLNMAYYGVLSRRFAGPSRKTDRRIETFDVNWEACMSNLKERQRRGVFTLILPSLVRHLKVTTLHLNMLTLMLTGTPCKGPLSRFVEENSASSSLASFLAFSNRTISSVSTYGMVPRDTKRCSLPSVAKFVSMCATVA